jgi:hypothetical protein
MNDITPPTPTAGEATPPNNEPWYSTISDADLKGYTEKKGWKSPQDAVTSYKNLEIKLGTAINLPSENATFEELNSFYAKLGRPETPDAYALPVPDGRDADFASHMSKIMFDSGIPAKSANALATAWNEYQTGLEAKHNEIQAQAELQQIESLKQEWGAKYQTNEIIAQNAAKAFGVQGEQIEALQKVMGFDGTMKFFSNLGAKIGEDKFIGGQSNINPALGNMSKEQATAEYQKLISDSEFVKKYQANDTEARAIMENIWKIRTA